MSSIHHIALNAPDPEAVVNALAQGAGWGDLGMHDRARWIGAPNLYVAIHQSTGDAAPQPVHQQGIGHLCLQSARAGTWDDLAAAGVAWNAPPAPLGTGILYSYGRLPGGALIELELVPGGETANRPWVGHVAWVTADPDRLAAHYAALAGHAVHRAGRFSHSNFRAITGHDDVDVEARWLAADNIGIEIWRYHHPRTEPRPAPAPGTPGWRHVAFTGGPESATADPDDNRVLSGTASRFPLSALPDPGIVRRRA